LLGGFVFDCGHKCKLSEKKLKETINRLIHRQIIKSRKISENPRR